jgi:hypothetical protein
MICKTKIFSPDITFLKLVLFQAEILLYELILLNILLQYELQAEPFLRKNFNCRYLINLFKKTNLLVKTHMYISFIHHNIFIF